MSLAEVTECVDLRREGGELPGSCIIMISGGQEEKDDRNVCNSWSLSLILLAFHERTENAPGWARALVIY